jgi:hypothetical protein
VINTQKLALALALLLCAGMWLYVDRVLIPYQKTESARRGIPRGNLSDLYPRWLASRELLLRHRDPYSSEITREIQAGYYGRPLDPALKNDPTDQQAFAYPVYVAFLLAPTVQLPFPTVQTLFRWIFVALTALSVVLWLHVVHWRLSVTTTITLILLTFSAFPVVQGIKLQQLTLLVAPLVVGCLTCLVKDRQVTAGVLLALATIKPQITAPLIAWLLLWGFSSLVLRWKFVASVFLTVTVLIVSGEYLLPGWIHEFAAAVGAYLRYNGTRTLLDGLMTHALAVPIEAGLVGFGVITCWKARRSSALAEEFCWSTSLVLAVTVLVMPSIAPYNQLLLLPGVFLVLRSWSRFLRVNHAIRVARGTAAAFTVFSWVSAAILDIASFFTSKEQRYWLLPLWSSIVMPFLLTVCLVLSICFPPRPSPHALDQLASDI